jgi:hypothetical protein
MISAGAIRLLLPFLLFWGDEVPSTLPVHTINLIADRNSVFRVVDGKKSELDLVAGESILLRVEARKARSMNRDGSVHGLVLLDPHGKPVPNWDLFFKPGMQEMQLTAPSEPGIYKAVCTVICGPDHDQMKLRVVVNPR